MIEITVVLQIFDPHILYNIYIEFDFPNRPLCGKLCMACL